MISTFRIQRVSPIPDLIASSSNTFAVIETVMNRVPVDIRQAVHDFVHPKSSAAQRRAILLKKGLLRSTVDELEILSDTSE
jgi:hypothetical protein